MGIKSELMVDLVFLEGLLVEWDFLWGWISTCMAAGSDSYLIMMDGSEIPPSLFGFSQNEKPGHVVQLEIMSMSTPLSMRNTWLFMDGVVTASIEIN